MEIKSEQVTLNVSQENVFMFLKNMNNWEQLMPKEKIKEWQSTESECSFKIESLASIGLKLENSTPNSELKIESAGKSPFPFTINVNVTEVESETSNAQLIFNGQVNPFLKAMVQTPLTNFFNMLADKLKNKYS